MRKPHGARTAVLTGLAGFLVIQGSLTGLLAGKLSWLRSPDYGHKARGLREAIKSAGRPRQADAASHAAPRTAPWHRG